MPDEGQVAAHYTHGSLAETFASAVAGIGKVPQPGLPNSVTVEDLAPVDEFHIGGRAATRAFLGQLGLGPGAATGRQPGEQSGLRVLDVGCGVGGPARFAALEYGCHVTGVDLTPEFVATGQQMNAWVGLQDRVQLVVGSALALPFADASFDAAYMLHVGMNIADKRGMLREMARVVKPAGRVGVYDVMWVEGGASANAAADQGRMAFPVPWASTRQGSALGTVAEYRSAFQAAGLRVVSERSRVEFALEFFEQMRAKMEAAQGGAGAAPSIGLHLVMGATAPVKVRNMVENVKRGLIGPVEVVGVV